VAPVFSCRSDPAKSTRCNLPALMCAMLNQFRFSNFIVPTQSEVPFKQCIESMDLYKNNINKKKKESKKGGYLVALVTYFSLYFIVRICSFCPNGVKMGQILAKTSLGQNER
jgi:hypothetical protein